MLSQEHFEWKSVKGEVEGVVRPGSFCCKVGAVKKRN